MKKKEIRWDVIKRQFESGEFSIRELARLHGIDEKAIRNKRDRFGWTCELSSAVKKRTKQKLVRRLAFSPRPLPPRRPQSDPDPDSGKTPEEIEAEREETIEAASDRKAEVVTLHQRCLRTLIEAANTLGERCKQYLDNPKTFNEKALPFRANRETVADVVTKCAGIQAKLIPLERQAYALDEVTEEDAASSLIEMWMEHKQRRRAEGKRVAGDEEEGNER